MSKYLQKQGSKFRQTVMRSLLATTLSVAALLSQVSLAAPTSGLYSVDDNTISQPVNRQQPGSIVPTDFAIRFNVRGNSRRGGSSLFIKKRLGRSDSRRGFRSARNHRSHRSYGRPVYRDHRGRSKHGFKYTDKYYRYRK